MKKIIFILALFVSFVANGQYTAPTGYTYFNTRNAWFTGLFRNLHVPAGATPSLNSGQWTGAGAVYVDSVNHRFYFYSGGFWRLGGEVTQSALNDTAAAIRGDFPNTGLSEIIAGYGLQNVNDSTLDVDSLVIANRDWVMDRISDINLVVDSLGDDGISPVTTWNNTLWGRRIYVTGGLTQDTTASGGIVIDGSGIASSITTSANQVIVGTGTNTAAGNANLTYNGTTFGITNSSGNLYEATSNSVLRTRQTGTGSQTWWMNDGSGEVGSISLGNPTNLPGIIFFNNANLSRAQIRLFSGSGGISFGAGTTGSDPGTQMYLNTGGRLGLGTTSQTATLHIKAGAASANNTPLKFTISGSVVSTTPEAGAVETNSSGELFYTPTASNRRKIIYSNHTTPSNGFLPIGNGTDFTLAGITEGQNINVTNGAGTITVAGATITKNAMVESPSASENLFMFRTPVAITVTDVTAVLVGGTPSVTYNISFGTDRTSATNVYTAGQTVTSETTGTAASGVNDATIPAGSWVWITTSAATDVTQLNISLTYTED